MSGYMRLPKRRFCSLTDDLRERLRAAGIEQQDLRFLPDPQHPERWIVSYQPPANDAGESS